MHGDSEILCELVDRIRAVRLDAGCSQGGLAHACGPHRTYIGSVERGERNVSVLSLLLVSTTLSIDAGDLLRGMRRLPN